MKSATKTRRSLSLRARLLAGLIVLTTVFLVVMGVVTTVVLGTLERDQLNAEVRLASRQSVGGMAAGADGVLLSSHGGRQLERAPVPLELVTATQVGQITNLHYRVPR